jgi:hypothetical protein
LSHSLRRRFIVPLLGLGLLGSMAMSQSAIAFRDRDCSDFRTQAQAQRFFERHNPARDPHRLDADHDGIACESLP